MTALSNHQINYDEDGLNFTFDNLLVDFDSGSGAGNKVRLKKLSNTSPEILLASVIDGFEVDRDVNDNSSLIPVGNATLSNFIPSNVGAVENQYLTIPTPYEVGSYTVAAGSSLSTIQSRATIRGKVVTEYSGNPTSSAYIFSLVQSVGSLNYLVSMYHSTGGNLVVVVRDGAGGALFTGFAAVWVPVAGTEYEIEFSIDTNTGKYVFFIDGITFFSFSTGSTIARAATSNSVIIGSYYGPLTFPSAPMKFRDIQIFDDVLHVSGDDFSSEVPRLIPRYFVGSQLISPSSDPTTGLSINTDNITGGSSVVVENPPGTNVHFITNFKGVQYWHDGANWVASNGTYAESNNTAEMQANILSFDFSSGGLVKFDTIIHSQDGLYTPEIENIVFEYDFFGQEKVCEQCIVYGHVLDNCEDVSDVVITFTSKPFISNGSLVTINETVTTDTTGYMEVSLAYTNLVSGEREVDTLVEVKASYTDNSGKKQTFKGKVIIPNQASILLGDLFV